MRVEFSFLPTEKSHYFYNLVHAYDEHIYPIDCWMILPYPCEVCLAIALFKERGFTFLKCR